jgi:hypothetical protein
LLFSAGFALVFAGLDWWADTYVSTLLPGRPDRLGLSWMLMAAGVAGLGMSLYLEWQLHRGVRQAAERADLGDQIGAVRQLNEATGHGLAHSAAAVRSTWTSAVEQRSTEICPRRSGGWPTQASRCARSSGSAS